MRLLTWCPSFHRHTKLTPHSILLFYDPSRHRAYSYTQSLAFGQSVFAQRWQAVFGHNQFATWHDCPLSVCLPNWRPTLLFYSMTFPNTERISIRIHWPSCTPYPPNDDKQVLTMFNSPPGITVLFPSVYQTDEPLYCFILWPFLIQSVFKYAVIGLRVLRIRPAMTSRLWPRLIRHLTSMSSFGLSTKLTIHSIVLFYDLFQHRAYFYTQSLAFVYSVSAWRWQAGSDHDQFSTW